MPIKETTKVLNEIIKGRRSIRKYGFQEINEVTVQSLIEAASWAPSPHDAQPWRFVVVRENDKKIDLAYAMAEEYRKDMEKDRNSSEVIKARLKLSIDRLKNAPLLILACVSMERMDHYPDKKRQRAEIDMAIQTIGAAVQNLLLTAHSQGLGACWMCAPLFCPEVVCESLKLPEGFIPQALITIGYPESLPKATPRRTLENVIIWR